VIEGVEAESLQHPFSIEEKQKKIPAFIVILLAATFRVSL
jgi:hypothetical protein